MPDSLLYQEWFDKAADDELSAQVVVEEVLNRYYIETRYPGDYPEFSRHDSMEALEAALRVKQFVLECIK